jgi:basic membrane lipoprotein Med (substrate-binding protein (PBP1-ABC) superfamily)
LRSVVEGKFKGGRHWLGGSEGAMGMTDMKYSSHLFSPEDLERLAKARKLLQEGKLNLPKRASEVEAFQPPEL